MHTHDYKETSCVVDARISWSARSGPVITEEGNAFAFAIVVEVVWTVASSIGIRELSGQILMSTVRTDLRVHITHDFVIGATQDTLAIDDDITVRFGTDTVLVIDASQQTVHR